MSHHTPPMSAIKFWVILLGITLAIILLNSCMTPKKAVDYLKKKDLLDDTCSANFPVDSSRVDSTAFITSKAKFDSLASELEDQLLTAHNENESLYDLINRLIADSTIECDSLAETIYRYAATEKKKTIDLQAQVKALKEASKNLKPKIEYLRDRAYEEVLLDANVKMETKLGQAETKIGALEDENSKLKATIEKKNKKIFWLYIIIAVLLAWIFRKGLLRLALKIINPIRAIPPI